MNLILHLIRKDFRHLRVLLAVWLGLAILQAVLIGSGLHTRASDMRFLFALSQFIGLLSLLKTLLLIMVVSQLVQSDSTVGSTAFWLSRPISGRKLLASKSLFLVLTVIIPVVLVEALLLLSNGVTLTDTLRSIPQIVLFQLFLTAVPMMLAALTPNLPKLFLLGIIAVVAFYLFHLTFMVFQLATPRGDSVAFFSHDRVVPALSCRCSDCCLPSVSDSTDDVQYDPRSFRSPSFSSVDKLLDLGSLGNGTPTEQGNRRPGASHSAAGGGEPEASSIPATATRKGGESQGNHRAWRTACRSSCNPEMDILKSLSPQQCPDPLRKSGLFRLHGPKTAIFILAPIQEGSRSSRSGPGRGGIPGRWRPRSSQVAFAPARDQ